jgi:hypothetical protein
MSFSGTSITATGQSPAGKFNAQELLTKLRAATVAASVSTSVPNSSDNKSPSTLRSPMTKQQIAASLLVQDSSKTTVPSDEKFEVRVQLEKDIQRLNAEIARLKIENKSLKSDKEDLMIQMRGAQILFVKLYL